VGNEKGESLEEGNETDRLNVMDEIFSAPSPSQLWEGSSVCGMRLTSMLLGRERIWVELD
jgi:hypothetical protein